MLFCTALVFLADVKFHYAYRMHRSQPELLFLYTLLPDCTRVETPHVVHFAADHCSDAQVTRPRRTALRTSSAVLCRSSFSITRQRCVSTVCKLKLSRLAISLLLFPSANS